MTLTAALAFILAVAGLVSFLLVIARLLSVVNQSPVPAMPHDGELDRASRTVDRLDRITDSLRAELRDWEGRR